MAQQTCYFFFFCWNLLCVSSRLHVFGKAQGVEAQQADCRRGWFAFFPLCPVWQCGMHAHVRLLVAWSGVCLTAQQS